MHENNNIKYLDLDAFREHMKFSAFQKSKELTLEEFTGFEDW